MLKQDSEGSNCTVQDKFNAFHLLVFIKARLSSKIDTLLLCCIYDVDLFVTG